MAPSSSICPVSFSAPRIPFTSRPLVSIPRRGWSSRWWLDCQSGILGCCSLPVPWNFLMPAQQQLQVFLFLFPSAFLAGRASGAKCYGKRSSSPSKNHRHRSSIAALFFLQATSTNPARVPSVQLQVLRPDKSSIAPAKPISGLLLAGTRRERLLFVPPDFWSAGRF